MSPVLWFFDKNVDVQEKSLGFLHCKSGLSWKELSETLLETTSELKQDRSDCRSLGLWW